MVEKYLQLERNIPRAHVEMYPVNSRNIPIVPRYEERNSESFFWKSTKHFTFLTKNEHKIIKKEEKMNSKIEP